MSRKSKHPTRVVVDHPSHGKPTTQGGPALHDPHTTLADYLPQTVPTPCPPTSTLDDSEAANLLATLRAAGLKKATLVPRLGFSVSSCGLLIGFDQARHIEHMLKEQSHASPTRAYVFPSQYYIATPQAASDVKVYLPPMDASWRAMIQDALSEWKNTHSGVQMRYVDLLEEADIQVYLQNEDNGYLGFAHMPNAGRVGDSLIINVFYYSSYGASFYKNTVIHEMGHALGLAHSGGEDPSFELPDHLIPGTDPHIDPKAVMASAAHPWHGWSADELKAIAYLFPRHTYDDLTTFDNENWNGWQRGSNGLSLQNNSSGTDGAYIHTTSNGKLLGDLIEKTFTTLTPRATYVFTAKVKAYDHAGALTLLTLAQRGDLVGTALRLDFEGWRSMSYAFTAGDPDTTLVIQARHTDPTSTRGDNIALDDLHVRSLLHDVTDFTPVPGSPDKTLQLNDWIPGPGSGGYVLWVLGTGNTVFRLPTYGSDGNQGVVLSKAIDVVPGFSYTFKVKALASHANNPARLSLIAQTDPQGSGQTLFAEHQLTFGGPWETLKGTWKAPLDSPPKVTFVVYSHIATGMGNDYYLDDLEITETPPISVAPETRT